MQDTGHSETPPTRDTTRQGSMCLQQTDTVPGPWMWTLVKGTKSWHIGTTQRCNKLTSATSRTGPHNSGVFSTTLEVYNSGLITPLGNYADTRI